MPSGKEYDDPEAAYRRGYQHGAHAAVEAMASETAHLSLVKKMREWVGVTLHKWRYREQVGNRDLQPPLPPN
jgi:hypothetical protein